MSIVSYFKFKTLCRSQMTHLRASLALGWPLGDFGLKSSHWCSNSQHCALSVPGSLWGTVGCLLREALGTFRNRKCMFCREFIGFLQRNSTTWVSHEEHSCNEQEKLACSCSMVWQGSEGQPRPRSEQRRPRGGGEGRTCHGPGRGGDKEPFRNISQSELKSGHNTYST